MSKNPQRIQGFRWWEAATIAARSLILALPLTLVHAANAPDAPDTSPAQALAPSSTAPTTMQLLGIHSDTPVMDFHEPSRYYSLPPANGGIDPIDALGTTPAALILKGLKGHDLTTFVSGYVDRIEHAHAADAPTGLIAWFATHPTIREDFWLALSPQFDDATAAMTVFDTIRQHNAKSLEKFSHLAIAISVVYDAPEALYSSRYVGIFGVSPSQFSTMPTAVATFDYFTDPENQQQFVFTPDQLAWPVLVHLVDLDLSPDDATWVKATCASERNDIADVYKTVPYDLDKLNGLPPKLGSQPYSMPNLLHLGGVCGDQAYFTSRVAKSFGIPAMKVCGMGRYGPTSAHAWCGFLTAQKGRPVLDFTGRYDYDYYYTGDVFDPQTRTIMLDRTVEMLYDGLSLSYEKYRSSQVLSRAAMKLFSDKPALSVSLACQAIEQDTYNPIAWRVLAYHISRNELSRSDAAKWSNRMMKDLGDHPDMTLECLPLLMAQIPASRFEDRQHLYSAAFDLYSTRPDLQIRLRLAQCAELVHSHHQQEALELAVDTASANAKEGSLILPLVDLIVKMSKDFAKANADFQIQVVLDQLTKIDADFPQKRGDTVSQAYVQFQQSYDDLKSFAAYSQH